jgi:hypothetical protein
VPSSLGVGKHIGSLLICSFRGKWPESILLWLPRKQCQQIWFF